MSESTRATETESEIVITPESETSGLLLTPETLAQTLAASQAADPGEDFSALETSVTAGDLQWTFFAQSARDTKQVLLYSVAPVRAPEAKRSAVAEFVARANWGLAIGNLELDYDTGEVRVKTELDLEDGVPSLATIGRRLQANLETMYAYLGGLFTVIYSDVPPAQAILKIEELVMEETA